MITSSPCSPFPEQKVLDCSSEDRGEDRSNQTHMAVRPGGQDDMKLSTNKQAGDHGQRQMITPCTAAFALSLSLIYSQNEHMQNEMEKLVIDYNSIIIIQLTRSIARTLLLNFASKKWESGGGRDTVHFYIRRPVFQKQTVKPAIKLLSMKIEQSPEQFSRDRMTSVRQGKAELHSDSRLQAKKRSCGQYYRDVVERLKDYWQFTCGICCRQFQKSEVETLSECEHESRFCKSCIAIYFKLKLTTYEPIFCPHDGCKAPLNTSGSFFNALPLPTQRRYRKIVASMEKLHDANFRTCPSEECEGKIVFKGSAFECDECRKRFCLNCLQVEHKGECYLSAIQYFQNQLQLRRCPNCKFMIQRSAGCNYMKCRCRYQFCFACNAPYTPLHTCTRDEYGRVKLRTPVFKEEKVVEEGIHSGHGQETGIQESILLVLFMLAFVVPLLVVLLAVFTLRMAIRSIILFAQILLLATVIGILGMGPFTVELLSSYGRKTRFFLTAIYPLAMVAGCYCAFAELGAATIVPLTLKFRRQGGQLWRHLLVEQFE